MLGSWRGRKDGVAVTEDELDRRLRELSDADVAELAEHEGDGSPTVSDLAWYRTHAVIKALAAEVIRLRGMLAGKKKPAKRPPNKHIR